MAFRSADKENNMNFDISNGDYRIQQESSSEYLDAHFGQHDDSAVIRPYQSNNTQKWTFDFKGSVYTFQQAHNGQYLDAWTVHTNSEGIVVDHRVVTRGVQHNPTQEWYVLHDENVVDPGPVSGGPPTILNRLRQLSTRRYLDAYESDNDGKDYSAVTRSSQADTSQEETQLWSMQYVGASGDNTYTLRQHSSGRFLDAYTQGSYDAVTRTSQIQNPDQTLTQRWIRTRVAALYTIRQKQNGVYLDAYLSGNYNAVVRSDQEKRHANLDCARRRQWQDDHTATPQPPVPRCVSAGLGTRDELFTFGGRYP